ncbi:hypothetical protein NST17_20110 [Caldifermentibacillus hisashii]|uniref:Uncharacterized protein n=1 Tax=Caldifermentibacillus hisashii TaxID=996558 RepID=A0ABU9K2T7_9BACI
MKTLDAPVYEIKQDSEWYKKEIKRQKDTDNFFKILIDKYGIGRGFAFLHSEYFGVYEGTEAFKLLKDDVLKNGDKNGFHSFKKKSKYYEPIKYLIEQIEKISPFKTHDVFGLNNVKATQWVGDRWFFQIKNEELIKNKEEIFPIEYKEYLKVVMENLD